MKLLKKMWIYFSICILAFYILPLTGKYWGNEMILALIALPAVTLVVSVVYGIKNGFDLVLPMFIGIVFLSTLFIFYNYTAWVYIVAYILLSTIGIVVGSLFHNRKEQA